MTTNNNTHSLTLALDWTPNINHIGFFVAQAKGFYRDAGISVELCEPSQDNYATTPAKKVEKGEADFALCPLESIISYRTKSTPFALKAIAAVLQRDLSAIVVKSSKGITSPRDLDHKLYASYKAKYEDEIVRQMVRNDGGRGEIYLCYPDKLKIWDKLLKDEVDATWIFLNWEGVQVQAALNEYTYFAMHDFDIPYSYSPVLACDETKIKTQQEPYRAFVQASRKGFLYAIQHPGEACDILRQHLPEHDKGMDLSRSLATTVDALTINGKWGVMDKARVSDFLTWLNQHHLESTEFSPETLCTNELLV